MTTTTSIGRTITGIAAAAAISALTGMVDVAAAQPVQCSDHKTMITTLHKQFNETRHGIGLVSGQRVMELYVSGIGSWTIVFTAPNGVSCIAAAGTHWEPVNPAVEVTPAPQTSVPLERF